MFLGFSDKEALKNVKNYYQIFLMLNTKLLPVILVFGKITKKERKMPENLLLYNIKFKAIDELFNTNSPFTIIAGPCAIESDEQAEATAAFLSKMGVHFMRGGAFKPRTSPYSFQGLGKSALRTLRYVCDKYSLKAVTELIDIRMLDTVLEYTDIVQIGSRSMHNFPLLTEIGKTSKPVLLKRGFMSTMEEFHLAAEYILKGGNENLMLCERGIRSFENSTRNMLDFGSIALTKQYSSVPIIADLSHSLGRKDIVVPIARAIKAVGADGIMIEVHPYPECALSDCEQQLSFNEFEMLVKDI